MTEELAGGKLLLDRPAEAVARLTINNPEKRNALDHEILDAHRRRRCRALDRRDRDPLRDDHRRRRGRSRPATTSATSPTRRSQREAEALVAHPFHARDRGGRAPIPFPVARGDQRPLPRRRPRAGASRCDLRICAGGAKLGMPPAKLGLIYGHTGLQQFIDAVGVAAHQASSSSPAATSTPSARERDRARQRGRRRRRARERGGRARGRDRRQRAALDERQQARDRDARRVPAARPPSRSAS